MENKYWALILIGIIILSCIGGFIIYKTTSEMWYKYGYDNKICKICKNNYGEGYNAGYEDCEKKYHERINYCFEKCDNIYCLMIVGGCEDSRICAWDCLINNYLFAEIHT